MLCYCDKFWHRLDKCAISGASKAQPLPFVCPMDHVIDPSLWHGTQQRRRARKRPGMLAARADGDWEEGMPFRGRYWLSQIGNYPAVAMSNAWVRIRSAKGTSTEPSFVVADKLLRMTLAPSARAGQPVTHRFNPGAAGPDVYVSAGERPPSFGNGGADAVLVSPRCA
eukprot:5746563-Pleurochrysis_carterae.AAC.1